MYSVLAYYQFVPIEDPQAEVEKHKNFFRSRDTTGRIYLAHEGVNGQMSGSSVDVEEYIAWLRSDVRFAATDFKIHQSEENVFPRMTVKVRPQLVAFDASVDLSERGQALTPQEWRQTLEGEDPFLLIDVRNDYEWKIGRFEGAEQPPCTQFREFPAYTERLKEKHDPEQTKVLMYCTGGIRCEIYSAYLKQQGFKNVFQLDGGVIGYGKKEGNTHWEGKLFVFDDRLAVAPNEANAEKLISVCHHCQKECADYYNCANMDCNELFLCCSCCAEEHQGCCCKECASAPRLRAYRKERGHKPFRKKHLEPMIEQLKI